MEKWKVIEGFNSYRISNLGRIKSYKKKSKGRILKPYLSKKGYLRIDLYGDNKGLSKKANRIKAMIHVLVAKAFVENPDPENLVEVDHIDRVRDNPIATNLRWIDREGNMSNRRCSRESL
ncbi:MAG: NUMOD4 domain-containing protein [Candidatus Hodarchaeales archaeon]